MPTREEELKELAELEELEELERLEAGDIPFAKAPETEYETSPEPGFDLSAFLEGAAEAATIGTLPHIRGITGAAMETVAEGKPLDLVEGRGPVDLAARPDLERVKDLMKEYTQASRARTERLVEESPKSFIGGTLVGGLAVPGTMVPRALQTAGRYKSLEEARRALEAAKAVGKGKRELARAKAAERAGTLGKYGAGVGAIAGAATEEEAYPGVTAIEATQALAAGEPAEAGAILGEFGARVAPEAAAGAVGGGMLAAGVLPAAGATVRAGKLAVKGVHEFFADTVYGKAIMGAFIRGLSKGENLSSTKARLKVESDIDNFAEEIFQLVKGEIKDKGAVRQAIIQKADERGVRLDPDMVDKFVDESIERAEAIRSGLPEATREAAEAAELVRGAAKGKLVRKKVKKEVPGDIGKVAAIQELRRAEQKAIESGVDPEDIEMVFEEVDVPNKIAAIVRQRMVNEEGDVTYKKLASRLLDTEELGPKFKEVTQKVREGAKDLTRPLEMEQLRRDTATRTGFGEKTFKTPEARIAATKTAQEAGEMLKKNISELAPSTAEFGAAKDALKVVGLSDDMPVEQARSKLGSIIRGIEEENVSSVEKRARLQDLMDNLNIANPALVEKIQPQLRDLAERYNIITEATRRYAGFGTAFRTGAGKMVGVANITGRTFHWLGQRTPDELLDAGRQMIKLGGKVGREVGKVFEQMSEKDNQGRNALLYMLLQNPTYRQFIEEFKPEIMAPEGMER